MPCGPVAPGAAKTKEFKKKAAPTLRKKPAGAAMATKKLMKKPMKKLHLLIS